MSNLLRRDRAALSTSLITNHLGVPPPHSNFLVVCCRVKVDSNSSQGVNLSSKKQVCKWPGEVRTICSRSSTYLMLGHNWRVNIFLVLDTIELQPIWRAGGTFEDSFCYFIRSYWQLSILPVIHLFVPSGSFFEWNSLFSLNSMILSDCTT